MGRLLDIVRSLPNTPVGTTTHEVEKAEPVGLKSQPGSALIQEPVTRAKSAKSAKSAKTVGTRFDQVASLVLNILISENAPLTHMAILGRLKVAGFSRLTARQGIAFCQKYGWIEHNLISGYIVPGETSPSED